MAQRNIDVHIKSLYFTASEWTSSNPTLLEGEVGYESDTNRYKVGDGSTAWNSLEYFTPVATSSREGGIRIGYTESGKNYPVELNSSNQAYVNVPWTDTNTTYTGNSPITVSGTAISHANSGVTAGSYGPTGNVTSGTFAVPQVTVNATGHVTAVNSRNVTLPTNTNYYPTAFSWTNGTTAGPTGRLTGTGMSAVSFGAIPSASASQSGVVTTGNQTFAGTKTFNSTISGSVSGNAGTATKLQTARTITLSGAVTGSVSTNLGSNPTISTTLGRASVTGNLNDIRTPGFYYGAGSNTATNKPSGIDAFGLLVLQSAGGYYTQVLFSGNTPSGDIYTRVYAGNSWTSWERLVIAGDTIALTGDVTGSATIGSTGKVSISTTVADNSHNHSAGNITSGTLAVARGGTGIGSNPSLLVNLDSTSAASVFAQSPRPGVTGSLGIGNGGTNATTASGALSNLGGVGTVNGSSPISASKSGTTVTVSHANSGVTASTYGPSANATLAFGGTFTIPYVTVNATGHITASGTRTMTMPAKPSATVTVSNSTSDIYVLGTTGTGSLSTLNRASGVHIESGTSVYASNGFFVGSERSLKEDIKDTEIDGLEVVNNTNVVDYHYKDDEKKEDRIGFIAEDSDAILLNKEGKRVDLYNCIGVLFKAVQQLTARVNELKECVV